MVPACSHALLIAQFRAMHELPKLLFNFAVLC